MSYQRAMRIARLESPGEVGQQETLDHPALMQEVCGFDPWEDPARAYVESYRRLGVDWLMGIPKRAIRFHRGESSRHGEGGVRYTEWGLSGSGWREEYPVHDVEEVLAYDPLAALTVPEDPAAGVRADQALMGQDAIVTGIHYTTLFQYPIMTFGWELFLTAAAAEPNRFQRLLEGFAEVSRRTLEGWAASGPELVLIHDDVALERGPVFRPDWYRQRLFPLYERLLAPLFADPRLRVAFVSDGDYTPLIDDLAALGFHGFIVNDNMDMGAIARRLGRDRFLVGNASTLILTHGTVADVQAEVQRCVEAARPAAGHFIKATRDLPHNIPLANIRAYFDAVEEHGRRRS
ncbi:MAG: uroporphyrinogen decarboxylase family protein [Candidatus Latescibacterota bacterium]